MGAAHRSQTAKCDGGEMGSMPDGSHHLEQRGWRDE
jgi:hypothetical protein